MAYYKITPTKKGGLQAKIQVSGKDVSTGKNKLFVKRVYNTGGLSEAKFRKQVEKLSIEFEEDVLKAYKEETTVLRSKVLTFLELMKEWQANIKVNLSISYYLRAQEVSKKFNAFLFEQHLDDKPISVITVRDVQMFLNSFAQKGYQTIPTAKVKKDFPKTVNFRELAREHIITRCSSYGRQADKRFDERLDEYYLAVNIYRLPIFPHSIGQYLKRYEREWKMKEVTCHGLRHTYCSLLLSQNVPIQTVSKYMGHSDSTVTLKVYSHFIPDTQGIALDALNRLTD